MWLARNKETTDNPEPKLYLFSKCPSEFNIGNHQGWIRSAKDNDKFYILRPELFANIKWENSPVEIENVHIDRQWVDLKDFLTVYTVKFCEDGQITLEPYTGRHNYNNYD